MLKKRIFGITTVVMAIVLVFAFAGCGGGAGTPPANGGKVDGGSLPSFIVIK